MSERKQASSEPLMIRLARVAGTVAGTLVVKTAKVVASTESSAQPGGRKPSATPATRTKSGRGTGKKKAKRADQKRKRNRSSAN